MRAVLYAFVNRRRALISLYSSILIIRRFDSAGVIHVILALFSRSQIKAKKYGASLQGYRVSGYTAVYR